MPRRRSSTLLLDSPGDERREAHEDRLDVAAGAQPEQGAAVVDQVELDVPAAPAELLRAVLVGVRGRAAALDQWSVRGQERLAHIANERPALLAAEIVEEDAAHAPLAAAVADEEVFLRPAREAVVEAGTVRVADLLQHAMEVSRVLDELPAGREIRAAAEPGDVARFQVTHVHVHDRDEGVAGVEDERDPGGEEGLAGELGGGRRANSELRVVVVLGGGRGLVDSRRVLVAPHRREVAAALLEHLPPQLAHLAAAAAGTLPLRALELAAVQLLQPGADPVTQAPEELLRLSAEHGHVLRNIIADQVSSSDTRRTPSNPSGSMSFQRASRFRSVPSFFAFGYAIHRRASAPRRLRARGSAAPRSFAVAA